MKKISLLLLLLSFSITTFGQNNINKYKYVVVPSKFDTFKHENEYQLNAMLEFLLKKNNFNALYQTSLPEDYLRNNCIGLKADVKNTSGLLTNKVIIEFKDCQGNVVFASKEGKSKIKEFQKGYQAALRQAFESVEFLNYKYEPSSEAEQNAVVVRREEPTTVQPEVVKEVKEVKTETTGTVQSTSGTVNTVQTGTVNTNVLYAQPIANGFQLVDSTPKVVYILQETGIKDVFLVKGIDGIFYVKNGKWIVEYYKNNQRVQEEVNVKF
ncbi:hypothetical protein GWK08_16970 [Leptobacterium flavescens]|uniref:Secreted protein n=1 Tax=Leptobacterium flavescens TaxID=472055 RepID=A0A6P0URJ8_9FLAO|nr:hypothetical protein [Leptobacterium flavescens]NER15150.1 hypothetical protein [Leptobacterium flavescens]